MLNERLRGVEKVTEYGARAQIVKDAFSELELILAGESAGFGGEGRKNALGR